VTVLYFFGSHHGWPLPFIKAEFLQNYRLKFNYMLAFLVAEAVGLHFVALLGGMLIKSMSQFKVLYEEILRHMGEGLIALDRQNRIIFINNNARKLLSYKDDAPVVGRKFTDVFRRREDQRLHAILARREEVDLELDVKMRDAHARTINIKTSALFDKHKRIRGIIGIFTDLTVKKHIDMLERKAAKLDEMGEVAAGIAHEIRNPLASIRGSIQELGRLEMKGADNRRLAEIVIRESDRLNDIITDFLQYARMKGPVLSNVPLKPILEEVVLLLKSRPDAQDVKISLECDGDYTVLADPGQLNQVFLNLGINALEAMSSTGSLSINTESSLIPERVQQEFGGTLPRFERAVAVSFADTGRGISPEGISKIFTPFYTTKSEGTGMGLAVIDKIIAAHHGSIDVISKPEKGSTFRVTLPLARPGGK
jgi:PAS domain S-box-containing protein